MVKSKYNVGDKVLVRGDLCLGERYGEVLFIYNMTDFCDKIITIIEVCETSDGSGQSRYRINNCDCWWSDEMFVGKVNKIDSAFDNLSKLFVSNNMAMPKIVNYTYNLETALTTIEWADGTKTTVRAENPNAADQYTGFVTAVAKKACGNNNMINNLYDEWAVKRPKREIKKQILNNNKLLEEKRIAEKRKTKREQYLIRKEALRLKREYEAKKLANEKYGVPMDEDK